MRLIPAARAVPWVLNALRGGGINIVAIHQHMTGESPRMLFLHYWGVGRTEDLARTLAAALKKILATEVAMKTFLFAAAALVPRHRYVPKETGLR